MAKEQEAESGWKPTHRTVESLFLISWEWGTSAKAIDKWNILLRRLTPHCCSLRRHWSTGGWSGIPGVPDQLKEALGSV
jgi:hypothetical protein